MKHCRQLLYVMLCLVAASLLLSISQSSRLDALAATPAATPSAGLGKIAFVSDRDGHEEVYTMEADGSQQKRLTYSGSGKASTDPAWSPDGQRIAFAYGTSENSDCDGGQIYVMNADGTNHQRLSYDNFCDYNPTWSPDSKHIAFISRTDYLICDAFGCVYEMNSNGTNPQFLADTGNSRDLSYSPDGKSLVYYAWDGGLSDLILLKIAPDRKSATSEFLTAADHERRKLDANPAWSSDGQSILFLSSGRLDTCTTEYCFTLMDLATRQIRLFPISSDVEPAAQDIQHLSWSPDGKHLAFVGSTENEDKPGIWLTDANGNNVKRLTSEQSMDIEPAWQPVKLPQSGAR